MRTWRKSVFYLLVKVACETHVDAMDDDALRAVFAFVANHSEIVQRAQLTTLIENYPISDRIVDSVIASLLSHRCIQECAELLDRNHQFGRILQLYFSGIRTSERMDEIQQLAAKDREGDRHRVCKPFLSQLEHPVRGREPPGVGGKTGTLLRSAAVPERVRVRLLHSVPRARRLPRDSASSREGRNCRLFVPPAGACPNLV